jgi:hypothetical protein
LGWPALVELMTLYGKRCDVRATRYPRATASAAEPIHVLAGFGVEMIEAPVGALSLPRFALSIRERSE